jgi:surface antigen
MSARILGGVDMKKLCLLLISILGTTWMLEALADPPAHAPAHGWRRKHDPEYVGYTGTRWERDYDIREGHCNRDAIGAVLGGITGAAVGSKVGSGDGRTVAIIVGATLGALIGSRIGRSLDERDEACIGHALEIGSVGHSVSWENRESGTSYIVTPGKGTKSGSSTCRTFTLVASRAGKKSAQEGLACQSRAGVWEIVRN